jgi:hypothetical protein
MIADKYSDAAASTEEGMSTMSDYVHRGADQLTNMAEEQPGQTLMIACLAGFGVGLLLSRLVSGSESSYSAPAFDRSTAERVGRNLLDRVEHALPSMLRDRLMK